MNIFQRAPLDGVPVDVTCWGRFYDFFEKREGRWAIVRRQPIYEKDRLDPVDPAASLHLDRAVLETFEGYRHLGASSRRASPSSRGCRGCGASGREGVCEGKAWLAGSGGRASRSAHGARSTKKLEVSQTTAWRLSGRSEPIRFRDLSGIKPSPRRSSFERVVDRERQTVDPISVIR